MCKRVLSLSYNPLWQAGSWSTPFNISTKPLSLDSVRKSDIKNRVKCPSLHLFFAFFIAVVSFFFQLQSLWYEREEGDSWLSALWRTGECDRKKEYSSHLLHEKANPRGCVSRQEKTIQSLSWMHASIKNKSSSSWTQISVAKKFRLISFNSLTKTSSCETWILPSTSSSLRNVKMNFLVGDRKKRKELFRRLNVASS